MNYASLARRVPPSRRNEHVPFSTHMEVAALEPDEQSRWLSTAAEEGLTKVELRARIVGERNGRVQPKTITCPECGASIET